MGEDGSSSDEASGGAEPCAHCGSAIDTADWYPIAAERDEDGSLDLYHFCSEDCRTAWRGADPE